MKISVLTPSIRPAGLEVVQKSLAEQTFTSHEWLVEVGIPERGHDFNAAMNRMLRRAKGELVVIYQDYISIQPNGLESFWNAYQEYPDTFFTAPVGKTDDLKYEQEFKDIRWDWRAYNNTGNCDWNCWEIDWGAVPLKALKAIGGFDEEIDGHWSCDNVNVGCRAQIAGYKFRNVWKNWAMAFDHDKVIKHPFRESFNPIFNNARMDKFRMGLKINHLQ